MIEILRLVWDEWNIEHVKRHNVTPQEVEEVCHGRPLDREGYKQRIIVFGPTRAGRVLAVILEPTDKKTEYYPVTAYESRKARRIYQKGGEVA